MRRRTFVATVGLASLAGCAADNNGGGSTDGESEQSPDAQLPSNAPENTDVVITDNLLEVYLSEIEEISEIRVVDDGELRTVEPANDVFIHAIVEVWNMSEEERDRMDSSTFRLWSAGDVYIELLELPGGHSVHEIRDERIFQTDWDRDRAPGFESLNPDNIERLMFLFDVPESSGYLMEWEPTAPIDGSTERVYLRERTDE
ncbi:hypothetical protein EGH24_02115 [Halonotius terrestris]|uniref:DUF4352 domain-containing protein n=1 Tax=Halonotius terrestris TaxID=2487750 RepID=A0A8J8PBM7_9EURY|nr:hypothetical protein [Halonotius terrestris]TQQ83609.1 hypothetical protein EGH24_02115 [Halonotius terrestris]